jgi:hypothetical protein
MIGLSFVISIKVRSRFALPHFANWFLKAKAHV